MELEDESQCACFDWLETKINDTTLKCAKCLGISDLISQSMFEDDDDKQLMQNQSE